MKDELPVKDKKELNKNTYALISLALSVPGGIITLSLLVYHLLKAHVITSNWAIIIILFIVFDAVLLLIYYALRGNK